MTLLLSLVFYMAHNEKDHLEDFNESFILAMFTILFFSIGVFDLTIAKLIKSYGYQHKIFVHIVVFPILFVDYIAFKIQKSTILFFKTKT